MDSLRVFCGTTSRALADRIAHYLDLPLGRARVDEFPDGELIVKLEEDVRGRDVFIIQSTCAPVNRSLMELLIYVDCLRRASAQRITAVVPYFGYARQDRKDEGRTPITAKLVANLITSAGADRVLTMDLHAAQIQGFFDIPVDHLLAEPVFVDYFSRQDYPKLVLLSPDLGNIKHVRMYAERMRSELAVIDKRRQSGMKTSVLNIIGDVADRTVLMIDDMISTAGTMYEAAKLVRERGAKRVIAAATHPVLCHPAINRLRNAPIDQVIVADTIPLNEEAKELDNLEVLSVGGLLGEAIRRIHQNESVSSMFLKWNSVGPRGLAGEAYA
jgi:ribose-phosphate pyrophosphokinase